MIGKKINQLATELAPASTDLTIIGNPTTGVSKKITLAQLGAIFSGAISFYSNLASFPATGSTDVIFCAKDTQKLYLWSGSAYVEVFPSQALLDTYQLRSEKGNANGYASLDSSGKVPISQLPSSIMEYKGTWSAATNTPTLANGTGDTGDVYLCNAAGTVNFGAGSLTFAVGDYVVYSGSIWQRSSGAVGTVTSVALSVGGDAMSVSGSPVTTSGTLALAFSGTTSQYIRGNGTLANFPTSLITGSGTTNFVSKFTSSSAIGSSQIWDNGTSVLIGTTGSLPNVKVGIYSTTQRALEVVSTNANALFVQSPAAYILTVSNGTWQSQFTNTGRLDLAGDLLLNTIANATTDTDKFLVSDSGVVKYRTGTELLSDIGAQPSGTYVTSVGVTRSGDALSITGSPVTSSGTINIGFAGSTSQYIRGDGTLATMPSIISQAQNLVTEVYNSTGATLTKGTVVYINGGQGNLPTITKAIATGDSTSAQTYGIVQADITNNNNGYVVVAGRLLDIDTQAYAAGTQLYLSSTTAGAYTSTKQYAPAHLVYVGIIVRSHPTQGVIEVKIQNGYELDELHNVSAQTPGNNQGLFYNTSTSLWENKSIATALGYTPISLSSLSAVTPLSYNSGTGTFSISAAGSGSNGFLSSTDWNTFNNKQSALNGTGFVKISGTTISYDNSTYYLASNPNGYTTNVGTVTSVGLSSATSGVTIGSTPVTTSGVITLAIATASGSQQGLLSSTDWTTFNNKQNALTNPVTGTGTTNYLPKFTGTSTIGNSNIINDASGNIGIGTGGVTYASTTLLLRATSSTSTNYAFIAEDNATNELFAIRNSGATSIKCSNGGAYVLDITNTAASTYCSIVLRGNSRSGEIDFATNSTVNAAIWSTSNSLIFAINGYTEAMRLNSSGNLSIGNTNDTYKLDVSGTIRASGNVTFNGTGFFGSDVFTYNNGGIFFSGGGTYTSGIFQNAVGLNLQTGGSPKLTITNAGLVGIGTSSPLFKLDVRSSGTGSNTFAAIFADSSSYGNALGISNGNGVSYIYSTYLGTGINSDLAFQTTTSAGSQSEKMRITSGGNVGIGTTSPTSPLHVGTGTSGNQKIQHWGEPGFVDNYGLILRGSSLDGVFKFYGLNNGTETTNPILSMNRSNGNVGIGTTSPATTLHVAQDNGAITLTRGAGTYGTKIVQSNSDGSINFQIGLATAGSWRTYMRLGEGESDPSLLLQPYGGKVGIGTTSPTSKLHVVGLPTSSAGLTSGAIWNDGGTLKIV